MTQTKNMIVSTAIQSASAKLNITPKDLTTRMLRTNWGSVSHFYEREFNRRY